MEMFELRYFLAAAKHENLQRAAREVRVSPPSLSKAIARLEGELGGAALFERQGRGLRLTAAGALLRERASQILLLEASARAEIGQGRMHLMVAGREALLASYGLPLSMSLRKNRPQAAFEYLSVSDDRETLEKVLAGNATFGITTSGSVGGLLAFPLGRTTFCTFVGKKHRLFARARGAKGIPVEEVMEHGFVVPAKPLLGTMHGKQSIDGWRDDRFRRRIDFVVPIFFLLKQILEEGHALAYLPDHLASQLAALPLSIEGCPFACSQEIRLVGRSGNEWIFSLLDLS